MKDNRFWQTKLAARLHDPGEKALILLRDRAGHEGGTVKVLQSMVPLAEADHALVKRADWWAAAADRPQWPREQWAQVRWYKNPVLIHPLSGEEIDLAEKGSLADTDIDDIKDRSLQHSKRLVEACGDDPRKIQLALWRFGPEISLWEEEGNDRLGKLWGQLPADTRVPDHAVWDHLDLVPAFAGAFAGDPKGEAVLLALSIGPVQSFIAAARSTSDLWAGSHLLARLAWEAMKPLVEELGPDAVLFPRLRGIPQVDLWLREQGLPDELFAGAPWKKNASADNNPLFAAALPNRFVALVPAARARELADACRDAVRGWLQTLGRQTVERLLREAGVEAEEDLYCIEQARRQLDGFPEVHWAAVPFSLIRASGDAKRIEDTVRLSEAMAPFFGRENGGFLESQAWKVLQKDIDWPDGTSFFQPNPGVLYPAIYELAERVLAAAKSVRAFGPMREEGWRDFLTGEAEWLTDKKDLLTVPSEKRKSRQDKKFKEGEHAETLWTRIADEKPAWAKKGEHLGALSALKRLWPTLFAEEAGKAAGIDFGRFVVSTHTMALAHQLDHWLEHGGLTADGFREKTATLQRDRVALPARLMLRHREDPTAIKDARSLLALMEQAQELDDEAKAERLRRVVKNTLKKSTGDAGNFRLETYYGLILMDGDRMGALLAGDKAYSYRKGFHPQIRDDFDAKAAGNPGLKQYGDTPRAVSPGRHMAISGALNDFAVHVVPHVVQREFLGRLIYGGGDDVLAMLPVADLLPAASRLRDAWSGQQRFSGGGENDDQRKRLELKKGYAWLDDSLYRMMGSTATASAGLVVAHHQAPLGRVLRELREAEKAAKEASGQDALHIRVIKRSGGALNLTLKWENASTLERLIAFLREPKVSRRAVYHCQQWLRDLPSDSPDMTGRLLGYQFRRQAGSDITADHHGVENLAQSIVSLGMDQREPLVWIGNFLSVAEFLARETRSHRDRQATAADKGEAA